MNPKSVFHTAACFLVLASARAEFLPTAAGPYDYDTTGNWVGGTIDGTFSKTLTANQAVTFDSNYALLTGLNFQFGGNFDLTFRGDGTNRSITMGGGLLLDTTNGRTVTLGSTTAGQNLAVDFGNKTIDIRNGSLRINNAPTGTGTYFLGDTSASSTAISSLYFQLFTSTGQNLVVRSTDQATATRTLGNLSSGGFTFNGNMTLGDGTGSISQLIILGGGGSGPVLGGAITDGVSSAGSIVIQTQSDAKYNGATSNTYTGLTNIDSGNLILAKTGSAKAISGNVQIGDGEPTGTAAGLRMDQSNQFATTSGTSSSVIFFDGSATRVAKFRMNTSSTAQNIAGLQSLSSGNASVEAINTGNYTLTLSGTGNYDYSGVIKNGGGTTFSVIKSGTGVQRFSVNEAIESNTYTGTTAINAGTLIVNTTHTGGGAYTVNSGGTLAGTGTIGTSNANVTIRTGGTLSPGDSSAETLTLALGTGQLLLENGVDLNFTLGSDSDRILLTSGLLSLGSGLIDLDEFNFTLGSGFAPGTYFLFNTAQSVSGSLGANVVTMLGGYSSTLSISGNDLILTVVPEPHSWVLLLGGGIFLILLRRKRLFRS